MSIHAAAATLRYLMLLKIAGFGAHKFAVCYLYDNYKLYHDRRVQSHTIHHNRWRLSFAARVVWPSFLWGEESWSRVALMEIDSEHGKLCFSLKNETFRVSSSSSSYTILLHDKVVGEEKY